MSVVSALAALSISLMQSLPEQIGAAMAGVALGLLLGQPMGGALYRTFGWRGPFLFGIICSSVDLIGRLLVIERAEALKWGHDPAASLTRNSSDNDCPPGAEAVPTGALEKSHASSQSALDVTGSTIGNPGEDTDIEVVASHKEGGLSAQAPLQKPPLSLPQVIIRLGTSPRALTACLDVFVIGYDHCFYAEFVH
jgi:DHA1 family solute carrier family 18 vesicular amine transporter 1/2